MAVKITTYESETKKTVAYYSYESDFDDLSLEDLREDFPLCLGSNQSIEEIDQFDL